MFRTTAGRKRALRDSLPLVATLTLLATIFGPVPSAFAATATHLSVSTQPSGAVNGVNFTGQPVVQLLDASNAVDTTDITTTVTVSIASGTGTLSGGTTVTANAGVATFATLRIVGTVGSFTLLFTASTGITAATSSSFTLTFGAATAAVVSTQPSGAVSGSLLTTQPVVRIVDSGGNTVTNSTETVFVSLNPVATTQFGGTKNVAAVNGFVTYVGLFIISTPGSYTMTFTPTVVPVVPVVSSSSFALTDPPAKLGITTQPTGVVNGTAVSPSVVVAVQDSSGNTITGSAAAISVTLTGAGTLSGTTSVNASSGVATFSNLIVTGTIGSYALTFASAGLTSATSSSFALTAGAASKLALTTSAAGFASGAAFTTEPKITIQDSGGNTRTADTSLVTATVSAGATLVGTVSISATSGVADFAGTGLGISGTAGTAYTVTFTVSGLTVITQSISPTAGAASRLGVTTAAAGAASGIAFTTQPAITVQDSGGNTVTTDTSTVSVAITGGAGGALVGTVAKAAIAGVATFTGLGISGTAGTVYTLTYTDGALTLATQTITPTAGAASTATSTVVASPTSVTANGVSTSTLTVQSKDANGNSLTASGGVVTFLAPSVGAVGAVTNNNNGSYTAVYTSGVAAGAVTITAQLGGVSLTSTATVTLSAGAATQIAVNAGNNQSATAGSAVGTAPSVIVKDANNNPVSGVSVTFAVATGGGSVVGGGATTNASGVATATSWTLGTTAGSNTLTATSGSLTGSPVTFTATGTAGAASAAAIITQPSGAVNGVALSVQPVVRIVDANGNTVTSSTVNVVATIASGTLAGTTTVAAVAGVATFTNLAITGTAGSFTLTFTPVALTAVTSAPFSLTFGAASAGAITTQPSGAVSGVAFLAQPVVRIVDSGGNTVTNSTVNVVATIASGTGALAGITTVAAVAGVATFTDLSLTGAAGSFALKFTPTGLTQITSSSFGLPGPATASAITTQPSGAVSGVAFSVQPVVRIVDASGNTVTNSTVSVVATIASGTGTLSGITTVAAVAGVATFTNLALSGAAGPFTLTFTPAALTPATSASLALTVVVSGGGGVVTPAPEPVTPTATVEVPVTQVVKSIGDSNVKVLFNATGGSPVSIAIALPNGAISNVVTISIAPAVTPTEVSLGIVSVKVTATDSTGTFVTHFNKPLALNLGKVAIGTTAVFSQDDLVWKPVAKLDGATLPDGLDEGYYIAADGSLIILTRHLTYFGVKKAQAPLTINALATQAAIGKDISLSISGGSGSGIGAYVTSTPSVCTVGESGTVTGLKTGTCTVLATKNGDGTYLNATSSPVDLTFVNLAPPVVVPVVVPVTSPTKRAKGLTVTRSDSVWLIALNLGRAHGGQTFNIQIREPGTVPFKTLAVVKLNKMGIAQTKRSSMPLGADVRVLSNFRKLASAIVR